MPARGSSSPGRAAACRPVLAAAALLIAFAAAGCSSGGPETCGDISGEICGRLESCNTLSLTFSSPQVCVDSFDALFKVDGSDAAACRETWASVENLDCSAFSSYFKL